MLLHTHISLLFLLLSGAGTKTALALPNVETPGPQVIRNKNPIPGRYIVQLKPSSLNTTARYASPLFSGITHRWAGVGVSGFAGAFSAETVQALLVAEDVAFVEEDGEVSIFGSAEASELEGYEVEGYKHTERAAAAVITQ